MKNSKFPDESAAARRILKRIEEERKKKLIISRSRVIEFGTQSAEILKLTKQKIAFFQESEQFHFKTIDLKSEFKKRKEMRTEVFLIEYPKKCKSFFF